MKRVSLRGFPGVVLRGWPVASSGRFGEWAKGRGEFGFVWSKFLCASEDENGVLEAWEGFRCANGGFDWMGMLIVAG